MNNSIHKGPIEPDGCMKCIKEYVQVAVYELEKRYKQDQTTNENYVSARHLKLFDPVDISVRSPGVFLLTGDADSSRALFMRILQSIALERETATRVVVQEGEGLDITNSLISQEAQVDITLDKRAWTDPKYLNSLLEPLTSVAESKIHIVDAPFLYASIAHASDCYNIRCLCVTGFPENNPVEVLKTLKGFSTGRSIPVIVLNSGEPIDHKDLWEHVDTSYHMEAVEGFEYLLMAESKRLKAKEEAKVMLNPTRKWITSIDSKCIISTREGSSYAQTIESKEISFWK